jgi:hypothetical protein
VNFIKAMEEFAGEYISSGFRGDNPVGPVGGRYLIEVAFERYIAKHQKYTLTRVEDATWTVFHTNVQGKKLVEVREKYLARIDVGKYMNARIYNRVWGGSYYGLPALRWVHFKWKLSDCLIQPLKRSIRRLLGIKPAAHQT